MAGRNRLENDGATALAAVFEVSCILYVCARVCVCVCVYYVCVCMCVCVVFIVMCCVCVVCACVTAVCNLYRWLEHLSKFQCPRTE